MKVSISSPAKINLHLKILDKNSDGYHNLDTSFQFIDLYDFMTCLLYTSPSPRDKRQSRMPSSA